MSTKRISALLYLLALAAPLIANAQSPALTVSCIAEVSGDSQIEDIPLSGPNTGSFNLEDDDGGVCSETGGSVAGGYDPDSGSSGSVSISASASTTFQYIKGHIVLTGTTNANNFGTITQNYNPIGWVQEVNAQGTSNQSNATSVTIQPGEVYNYILTYNVNSGAASYFYYNMATSTGTFIYGDAPGGPIAKTIKGTIVAGPGGSGIIDLSSEINNALISLDLGSVEGSEDQTDKASIFYQLKLTPISTLPTVTPTVKGTLGMNGWYISRPTTLEWTVIGAPTPTTSGCGTVTVPDTTGTQYTCSATNANGTGSDSVTIKKDSVAPKVVIKKPASGATYALSQNVLASYSCTDATSGVASCVGTVPDGTSINTASPGPQTFSVVATDNAGNTITKTVGYTVQ